MSTHLPYWIAALYLPGIGPQTLTKWLASFGDIEQLFMAKERQLANAALNAEQIQAIKSPPWPLIERALQWMSEPNHHLILQNDADYPPLLNQISNPPWLLFVAGNKRSLMTPQLAMVGARNASPAGLQNAENFASYLAQAGFTITSGLALGIDGASHRGALKAGGCTIGVAGTGLHHFYPSTHRMLTQQVIEQGGAVISEFPLEMPPHALNFPRRNRIISGLSLGVLVVEAALKSGSMITVRYALEQGREVFAMPGSIHHPLAKGCHHLIRQGAKLVEEGKDIVEELGGFFVQNHENAVKLQKIEVKCSENTLKSSNDSKMLSLIGYEVTPLDMLLSQSGLTPAQVSSILLRLELEGHIQSLIGGYVRLAPV